MGGTKSPVEWSPRLGNSARINDGVESASCTFVYEGKALVAGSQENGLDGRGALLRQALDTEARRVGHQVGGRLLSRAGRVDHPVAGWCTEPRPVGEP